MTATIRLEPEHFNAVCYATIPKSWTIFPDDGSPKIPCDDMADALVVARRLGFTIRAALRGGLR